MLTMQLTPQKRTGNIHGLHWRISIRSVCLHDTVDDIIKNGGRSHTLRSFV